MPKYWMEAAANIWATGSGTIRDLGLEYHIVFNKGAVMVLPPGTNKATGLKAALADLDLSTRSVIGIGDAENDFAFLEACGCSADVGNAKPALKNMVGVVLEGRWARGVMELIEQVISKDAGIIPAGRHGIRVGIDRNGDEVQIVPYRPGSFTTLHSARARSGLLAVVFGQKEGRPAFLGAFSNRHLNHVMAVRERGQVSASRSEKSGALSARLQWRTGQEQNDRNRRNSPKDY